MGMRLTEVEDLPVKYLNGKYLVRRRDITKAFPLFPDQRHTHARARRAHTLIRAAHSSLSHKNRTHLGDDDPLLN